MQQLIFKKNIEKSKMDALLNFLKSWDIEAELRKIAPETTKKKTGFSLSVGIWEDYDIDANELRNQAWNRKK